MKTACIVNPISGGGKHQAKLQDLRQCLKSHDSSIAWEETQAPGHATELAQHWGEAGVQRLVVIGGDGTLSEVANGILPLPKGKRPAVALIAQGTGGDYSRRLKELAEFPQDPAWLFQGKNLSEKWVDVGQVKFIEGEGRNDNESTRYFLNIAQAGLGGEVVKRVNQGGKKWGGLEYPKATLLSAMSYRAPQVEIRGLNSKLLKMKLLVMILAKGRYFGGGMCIAPEAQLEDGLFQNLVIPPVSYFSLLYYLPQVYRQRRLRHPKVYYYQSSTVEIRSLEGPLPLDLDGEFYQAQVLQAKVLPKALRVLLPV